MPTLAIIGSRSFTDQARAEEAFKRYCCEFNETTDDYTYDAYTSDFDTIVSGGAHGADSVGAEIARKWGLKLIEHIPDWDGLGKRAGFVRNEKIIADADVVLAFWDGVSKGTGHSLSIAKRLKKTSIVIYV